MDDLRWSRCNENIPSWRSYSAFGAPDSLAAHTPKKPATL
jgi:hypothetical protein